MSRRTAKDRAFARAFGAKLRGAFKEIVKDGKEMSVKEFAESLNLTRAGLHKAMKGESVPSLDLIQRAQKHKVEVKYGDLRDLRSNPKRKMNPQPELQLFLPFAVENLKKENVRVELGDHIGDTVELKVSIKFAG